MEQWLSPLGFAVFLGARGGEFHVHYQSCPDSIFECLKGVPELLFPKSPNEDSKGGLNP